MSPDISAQPDAEQIMSDIKRLTQYLQECEARIHKGEVVDLSGFAEHVSELCGELPKLPVPQAMQIAPSLARLIERLDSIERTLSQQ